MESLALIDRVVDEPVLRSDLEDLVRLTWDRVAVVPVDQRCLDRAAALMREQPLRLSDALHLAAADRLPRPVRFVTFDPAQIMVALSLGYDVVSELTRARHGADRCRAPRSPSRDRVGGVVQDCTP